MALIGINPARARQKESTLDKILKGVKIAEGVLGTALEIPESIQAIKARKAQGEASRVGTAIGTVEKTRPISEGEVADPILEEAGLMGRTLREPKKKAADELADIRLAEAKSLASDKEMFDLVQKAAPELAGIPGITIGQAKKAMIAKNTKQEDPRITLALKSFDLALKKFGIQETKEGRPSQPEIESAGFAVRSEDADKTIEKFSEIGAESLSRARKILPGEAVSPEFQQLEQAGRNFMAAVLRKESGAAITPDEMAQGFIQYIPQPGDSKEVQEQKRRNRSIAIATLRVGAGERGALEQTRKAFEEREKQRKTVRSPTATEADSF